MNKRTVIGVLVICLIAFVAVIAFAQGSPNIRWEYTVIDSATLSPAGIQEQSNRLGQEGWQYISSTRCCHRGAPAIMVFKRRLP